MNFESVLDRIPCHLPDDECWEYQGPLDHCGYGTYENDEGKSRKAHRLMFERCCDPLSVGELVRHTCDNPSCCNPHHLLKGTQLDNMRDCIERGRFPDRAGEKNGRAKLTQQLVQDIRKVASSGMWSYGLLAQLFDTPKSTIANVLKERSWTIKLNN